jgi:hypothetical protein
MKTLFQDVGLFYNYFLVFHKFTLGALILWSRNLMNEGAIARFGPQRHKKNLILISLTEVILMLSFHICDPLSGLLSWGSWPNCAFISVSFSRYVPSSSFFHSALRQVHSLFQSESSTECDLVLCFSISTVLIAYFISRVYMTSFFAY